MSTEGEFKEYWIPEKRMNYDFRMAKSILCSNDLHERSEKMTSCKIAVY